MTKTFSWLPLALCSLALPASISMAPVQAQVPGFCHSPAGEAKAKLSLLRAAIAGDTEAQRAYDRQVAEDARELQQCRARNWPKIRLFGCGCMNVT